MKVMVIAIVIDALGRVTKRLLLGLEDLEIRDEWRKSKLQHYWDRPEYWEESWRLEVTSYHSNVREPINHMKSECRKLEQKEYKTRLYWVG